MIEHDIDKSTQALAMIQPDSIKEVYRFLESIPNFQSVGQEAAHFDLDRFRQFCNAVGNPQDQFQSIHVGGTNGKGSTCQILASVYQQAGYNVGLYTSPHLLRYTERFMYNGREIPEEDLVAFFQDHISEIHSFRLSYFEISTAIAFWWFARKNVDIAIIEVGLGGRLDATNVVTPAASVITNVSRDHTSILGDTVQEIAREKAGIIKPGIPVITGNISSAAKKVICEVARRYNSPVYSTDRLEPTYKKGKHILHNRGKHVVIETGLETPIQVFNVAAAWQTAQLLNDKFPLSEQEVNDGISRVRTRYPGLGRFERLLEERQWYFDGGHNYEAVKAMKEKVETIRPVHEAIAVLSLMRDKSDPEVINEFLDFKKIFYHPLGTERAATFTEIQNQLPEVNLLSADRQSLEMFFKEIETELVIFTGSFYFYPTVRDWLASFTFNR